MAFCKHWLSKFYVVFIGDSSIGFVFSLMHVFDSLVYEDVDGVTCVYYFIESVF